MLVYHFTNGNKDSEDGDVDLEFLVFLRKCQPVQAHGCNCVFQLLTCSKRRHVAQSLCGAKTETASKIKFVSDRGTQGAIAPREAWSPHRIAHCAWDCLHFLVKKQFEKH